MTAIQGGSTAPSTRGRPIPCPRFGDPDPELKAAARRLQEAVGFDDRQAAALVAAGFDVVGVVVVETS